MILRSFFFVLLFVFAFQMPASLRGDEHTEIEKLIKASKTRAALVKQVQKAVVHIKVEKIIKGRGGQFEFNNPYELFNEEFFERFFPEINPHRQPRERKQEGLGSGSIINDNGYILTNHHVVGDADKITVKMYDGKEWEAKLVGTDPQSDIAVIKIERKNVPVLSMGNSDDIDVGESVIAIGNPFGLTQTVTFGIVSAKGRSNIGITDYEDFIQTDAAINPGNSGGPLINLRGEIIAVNTAIVTRSGGYQGVGFAVPINMARRIMNDLIESGTVSRGWLGVSIQDITPELASAFRLEGTEGSLITGVMPGTPAEKYGIQKGDVIIKINDTSIRDSNHLRHEIANARANATVRLSLIREGRRRQLTIKLGERPSDLSAATQEVPPQAESRLGLSVQNITPELAERLGYKQNAGVVVSRVEPGSPAASAGIRPGMVIQEVNKKPVSTTREFNQSLQDIDLKEGVLMLILSRQGTRYVYLKSEE